MSNKANDFMEWYRISNLVGWKIYEAELDKLIESYTRDFENDNLDGNSLKRLQLIRKGLKMARDIPHILEIRAKEKERKGV